MEAELRTEYYDAGYGRRFEKTGDMIVWDKRSYIDDDNNKLIQLWLINVPV
jgi:hypothetical protein